MVQHLNRRILTATVITVAINSQHVTFPPLRVVDLIDPVRTRVQQVLSVHDIVQLWVDLDVGWQVDDLDRDLLQVRTG